MTSKVVVTENFIRCPCCNNRIRLVQHKAHGAVYARSWKSINVQQLIFLKMWSSNDIAESFITKRSLTQSITTSDQGSKIVRVYKPNQLCSKGFRVS